MRNGALLIAVGVGVMLACGSEGETRRPRKPSSAALAVTPTGGCHVGKAGVIEIPPDGKYDLENRCCA